MQEEIWVISATNKVKRQMKAAVIAVAEIYNREEKGENNQHCYHPYTLFRSQPFLLVRQSERFNSYSAHLPGMVVQIVYNEQRNKSRYFVILKNIPSWFSFELNFDWKIVAILWWNILMTSTVTHTKSL